MHPIVSRITGLPARTQLRGGEWRCFKQYDSGHHKAFACVPGDVEVLTGEISSSSFTPPYWDIWSSAGEMTSGSSREQFYAELGKHIPEGDNPAAYKLVRAMF